MRRSKKIRNKFFVGFLILFSFFALLAPINFITNTSNVYADKNDASKESDEEDVKECKKSKLKGLNWILCPIAEGLSDVAASIYEKVEDRITVDTDIYDMNQEGGKAIYEFWEFCRNTANILMIIFLLFIIFSQLTGYGIDNYGIKKMLPKLITMAILINISFYICQIAVDVSNIVGSSMDNLLQSIGPDTSAGEIVMTDFLMILIGAGAGTGSLATAGISTTSFLVGFGAGGWILAVLVVIALGIYILIGYGIVLVMLAIRMVIIMVGISIAPLAFACYVLPNTKSIFKKWLDAIKAALIIYPIVGTLHGLSFIVRRILWSGDIDFFEIIVGIVASILPYYVIPTLLKKAIAATGMIGNAVVGIGQSVRKGYQQGAGAVKNTDAYKQVQERGQNVRALQRTERIMNRLNGRSNLSEAQRARLTNAQKKYDQLRSTMADEQAGYVLPGGNDAAARDKIYADRANARRDAQEFKNYHDQYANLSDKAQVRAAMNAAFASNNSIAKAAIIATAEERGMQDITQQELRNATGIGNDTRVLGQLAQSKSKTLKAYGKTGQGVEYRAFMDGTGSVTDSDGNTRSVTINSYIDKKGADFVKDIDEKDLQDLAYYAKGGTTEDPSNTNLAMSAGLLAEAGANASNKDSIDAVNEMLDKRYPSGMVGPIQAFVSASQLARMNADVVKKIPEAEIIRVSEEILRDPQNAAQLISKMSPQTKEYINKIRQDNELTTKL